MSGDGPGDRPTAWVLNLDAERELRDPAGFRRGPKMAARIRGLSAALAPLLGPGDLDLGLGPDPPPSPGDPAPDRGAAWCPTPSARARFAAAGLPAPDAPPLEVLRRVNARGFASEVRRAPDPGAPPPRALRDADQLARFLAGPRDTPRLLKTEFGFAGRDRRRLDPGPAPAGLAAWAAARLAEDGVLYAEPWVEVVADFAVHGWVPAGGGPAVLGAPTRQRVDPRGAWRGSAVAGTALSPAERGRLEAAAAAVAAALAKAGYFGPFGVDAFRWVDHEKRARLRALVEVNARFTMGWGIGVTRRDLW